MLVRESFSLFTSLYKNISNVLAILRVLVVDRASDGCTEGGGFQTPHDLRIFFRLLLVCKMKTEVNSYSFKPVPKVVVIDYCADP